MASNHTTNFNLSQWEENDEVLRTDFNADNLKLDAALSAAEQQLQTVQTQAAAAVQAAESKTAEEAARAKAAEAALAAKCGNCVVVSGSYTGNGGRGASGVCSLSFAYTPVVVLINGFFILVRDVTSSTVVESGSTNNISVSWGTRNVQWYARDDWSNQCNESGKTYHYVALLDKEG